MKNNTAQKNIPQGWKRVLLGDVCELEVGIKAIEGECDYLEIGDINLENKSYDISNKKKQVVAGAVKVPAETLLISKVRPTRGAITITNSEINVSQAFTRVKLKSRYLYFVLSQEKFFNYLGKTTTGSTYPTCKDGDILSYRFLYTANEKEQKRIAEILSTVDESIAKTEAMIEKTERLKKGLMQDLLSNRDKKRARCLALGDIGKVSMCKRVFKKETSSEGDIPFYKIGTFGKQPDSFISQKLFDNYRNRFSFPRKGDVLLSASGTIGRKVRYDGRPAYFQDSNIIWLDHDESVVLNNFLFYLYDTIKWQTEGSTIRRLYNNILLKKQVSVPSISKQKEVVEILSAVDEKIAVNKKLKSKLIRLKKGLMQDLLSGKVRV